MLFLLMFPYFIDGCTTLRLKRLFQQHQPATSILIFYANFALFSDL